MNELTEFEKVRAAAVKYRYWYPKKLIEAAIEANILKNLNKGQSYSYSRIYAMLREGKSWVTKKLIEFAEKNPKE